MFSGSQFDAPAAFGGGGFMSSQATQYGGDSNSSAARSRESHGLVPVTVKQISEAHQSGDEKSNFVIGGADVSNVSVLGKVFEKAEKSTFVTFTVDDGTGRMKCRRWVNDSTETAEMEQIQDGMYARVNGHLKVFQGVRELAAFSVRPVKNFDEVAFHYIECIHNHLLIKSGHADGQKSAHELILEYMMQQPSSTDPNGNGITTQELSRQLKLPMDKLMDGLRSLEDEGTVYTTVDEFHFKITST